MKREFRILSATAILGYGFPAASFAAGMEREPDLIAVDAGSTDPGPYYLGAGVSFTDRNAVKRDLEVMILAGLSRKIPVIIGSAGGSGAEPHLKWCREIVEEIAREQDLHFRLALIHAEFDKEFL
ncbi:MAG: 3-methylaspartate ammonia-lyase, partial [Clostridiaceae bacterium]|nr:3-methylaspartate ammonia-lyase [Clostridiaceae bacterium]